MSHKIKFLGASGMVTGSCYLLTNDNNCQIVIDCGMYQGTEEDQKRNREDIQCNPKELAGVILTHAHLDHCGRLPLLYQGGFNKKIYMTKATTKLAELVLKDAAKIAENESPEAPIYSSDDVREVLYMFKTVDYHKPFLVGDYEITLFDAGHLLGSASLHIKDTTDGTVIVFSGDLGNSPQIIEKATEFMNGADYVVMESTYGDRGHGEDDPNQVLAEEINEVEKSGGTLLIPAFALERTQELMNRINHLKKRQLVKSNTPFFVDGPMANKALRIYKQFRNLYNPALLEQARQEDPFSFPALKLVEHSFESYRIKEVRGTKVIIAGCGMMSGGRVLRHAASYLPDPKTRLLIVGYQGEGTLGREITEGSRRVMINDKYIDIKANVRQTASMSNHADQKGLMAWLTAIKGVKQVFLTHGDEEPRTVLRKKIIDDLKIEDVHLPIVNEEVELT